LRAKKHGFNLPVRRWLGKRFWQELAYEVDLYSHDSGAELNLTALRNRVTHDQEICRTTNSYRALHRSILLYGFLRWRRTFVYGRQSRGVSVGAEAAL
jgi:hypothetical protein